MRRALGLAALALAAASLAAAQEELSQSSLAEYWKTIKAAMPGKGSNGFVPPAAAELRAFEDALHDVLEGSAPTAAIAARLERLHYTLGALKDAASGSRYLVLAEKPQKFRGLGTYIVSPTYARNVILETPHPLFDADTVEEALKILEKTGVRAVFISGTHRCANLDTPSGCSGRTTACGGDRPFRISDVGHSVDTFFTAAHRATLRLAPRPVAISLHGNAAEPVDAELSDGTVLPAEKDSLAVRFRNAMEAHGVKVGSCNWPADDPSRLKLCGTTNVQGRMSNGSASACTEAARKSSGDFLHLEQRRGLRDNPQGLIEALLETFPAKGK